MSDYAQARRQVLDACRRLADRGFLGGTGGNISLRLDRNRFAITPSGVDYYAMQAEDICILDLRSLTVEEGRRKPSVESGMHAALLRFRSDATAGIHTHQPLASAVALLGLDLGPAVAVPYAPSGTWLLARALRKRLRPDIDAYLLGNHGLICCGRTMDEALSTTERIEDAARIFLRAAIERAAASPLAREALEALE